MTTTPAVAAAPTRLAMLDILRFLAAMAVVLNHWFYVGINEGYVQTIDYTWLAGLAAYGYLGVHLFFLVSGFVISTSVRGKTPAQFAVGRVVRLYPTYWVGMLLTAAVMALFGVGALSVTAPQVLVNLTMVSRVLGQSYVDGVYWTLFLELVFYVMVFLLVLVGFRDRLDTFFPLWALLIAAISFWFPALADEMLLGELFTLFAGGAIISTAQRRGWNILRLVGLAASVVVAVKFVMGNVATQQLDVSPLAAAAIVVAFYALILVQTVPAVQQLRIPFSQTLGGLTYPIYLIHANIGYIVFANFSTESNKWAVYLLALFGVLVVAYLMRVLVEIRAKNFWYKLFGLILGRPIMTISRGLARVNPRLGGLDREAPARPKASDPATARP